jgi:hypothetical protein
MISRDSHRFSTLLNLNKTLRPITVVVIVCLAALVISTPHARALSGPTNAPATNDAAQSQPGLDGNGISLCGPYVACYGEQLSTGRANDAIVLIANCSGCKISDSAGLAYIFRATVGSGDGVLSEYYAIANTPLSSDNVTVSLSYMHVFAVHGYKANIFDTPSPLSITCPTAAPCSGSVAPSGTDFVFTGVSNIPRANCNGVSGWNRLFANGQFASDYQIQSQPRTSSVSYLCLYYFDTGGPGTYGALSLMMDAISLQPQPYTLSWQGFDWDGGGEETVTLNSQFLSSLPGTDSPQNAATYAPFSLNTTSFVVQGTNTLTFTHANWDCGTSDNVQDLQVTSGAVVAYSNATVQPLSCAKSLTYTFTIGPPPPPPRPLVDGVAQSPTGPYANHPVTFTAAAGGGVPPYSFSWDFGDGSTGSGSLVSHTYASSGGYRITLTVQDSASPSPNTRAESWILVVSTPQSSGTYTLSWQGYDWDGGREETITFNGQFLASLPATDTPTNGGVYASFSLNITSFVGKGTNTLTFTHAGWDCGVSDNVRNLQVTSGTTVIYSNPTVSPLSCTQSLTYTFTV